MPAPLIVHLDDHYLITGEMKKLIDQRNYGWNYLAFDDTDKAFQFIQYSIINDLNIDVFITDFVHMSPDGYELAKKIRQIETDENKKRIPILLCTLVSREERKIVKGLQEKVFDAYFQLGENWEEIIDFIKNNIIINLEIHTADL